MRERESVGVGDGDGDDDGDGGGSGGGGGGRKRVFVVVPYYGPISPSRSLVARTETFSNYCNWSN